MRAGVGSPFDHCLTSNLFTLPSDMFPRHAVATVVGIGGFAGAVGGMLIATFIGLSIVQDLIKDYRGELTVGRSSELGGARFEVQLPPGP